MAGEALFRRDWAIRSELGQEKIVISEVRRTFQELQQMEPRIDEMVTAVSEACLNAIEHGNRMIKDLPVQVTMLVYSDRYSFRIIDWGNGMELDDASHLAQVRHKIDWENPRGWGLQLMRQYADSIKAWRNDGEFCIELEFYKLENY